MNDDSVWVTVLAQDAPQAASTAAKQHGGHVQRIVPDRTPGRWHVQVVGGAHEPQTLSMPPVEKPKATRPRNVLVALLATALMVASTMVALDQRSTAARWRDRSRTVEEQLREQDSLAAELRAALERSEVTVSELEARLAALAADAAADADAAGTGE